MLIRDMFDPGENLVWEGKPDKTAYVVGPVFIYVIAGIMLLVALILFGIMTSFSLEGEARTACLFIMFIALVPALVMGAVLPLWRYVNWNYINYAITDRRIYIEKGILGREIVIRDFTDIIDPEVSVDFIDKIRNCGSVHLTRRYYIAGNGRKMYVMAPALLHIPDPYGVFDMVKRMALDIKSDIHYPNALRPESNDGYGTQYNAGFGPHQ